jgi:predicted acyltransferase
MEVIPHPRIRSLDALRGFDMFWIIGGDDLIREIGKLCHSDAATAVAVQFSGHVEWVGFRYYDMIFPLFLFLIGAVLPFSIGRRLELGDSKKAVTLKVLKRGAILIVLGLIYNGLLQFNGWDHIRFFGVLQRQSFGYMMAALLMIYTSRRTQLIVFVAILLAYWGIMVAIPVPGYGHGNFTEWGNAANYIDRLIFAPGQMYEKYGDPEGPLSMIPAVSTALLGLFAGYWLKSQRPNKQKVLGMVGAGLVCILLGLAWSPVFPIIKKIWTSSYVLFAGGLSLELLALFYWLIDVRGWTRWSTFFVVIGSNAITIYMLSDIVDFGNIAGYFLNGAAKGVPDYKPAILAAGVLAVEWLLLYALYKRKIFLRV